jgi:hypothetical protein
LSIYGRAIGLKYIKDKWDLLTGNRMRELGDGKLLRGGIGD